MNRLKENWITDGLVDFEYKKYILLAYLHDIRKKFSKTLLYPYLSDLIFHYRNLIRFRDNKTLLFESFPKEVSKADFQELKIIYKTIIEDNDLMKELQEIVIYAISQMKDVVEEGREIYEFVEENIDMEPVGIFPIYLKEGYLILCESSNRNSKIYRYQVSIFEGGNEKFRGVRTVFLENITRNLGMTLESIKLMLIKKYNDLPNPATYVVNSKFIFPIRETLMPVVKRLLIKYTNAA